MRPNNIKLSILLILVISIISISCTKENKSLDRFNNNIINYYFKKSDDIISKIEKEVIDSGNRPLDTIVTYKAKLARKLVLQTQKELKSISIDSLKYRVEKFKNESIIYNENKFKSGKILNLNQKREDIYFQFVVLYHEYIIELSYLVGSSLCCFCGPTFSAFNFCRYDTISEGDTIKGYASLINSDVSHVISSIDFNNQPIFNYSINSNYSWKNKLFSIQIYKYDWRRKSSIPIRLKILNLKSREITDYTHIEYIKKE